MSAIDAVPTAPSGRHGRRPGLSLVQGVSDAAPGDYRLLPEYYEAARVPPEVLVYAGEPDTLAVGSPGKVGVLQLRFENVGSRTELVSHYQKSPLQIMRPIYFNPARNDMPYLYLLSTGGGMLQGDRHRTELHFGDDASAYLTTQAHTKIYRMDAGYAAAVTNISLGARAYVEYLPDPVIPFAGSRYYQRMTVTIDETASVLLGETVYAGRLACGERHQYDVYASDLELRRPDGTLLALDRVRLAPAEGGVGGLAVLAGHDVLSMLYVVTPLLPAQHLADRLHEALLDRFEEVTFGVSVLPGEVGVWMRLLSNDTIAVSRANTVAAAVVHELLTGAPAPIIRKN